MLISINIIATGKYISFVRATLESINKYFLIKHRLKVFLHTDSKDFSFNSERIQLKIIPTDVEPWPFPTLKRFHYMERVAKDVAPTDYCFYIDADMKIKNYVDDEILLNGSLIGVEHPGFCKMLRPWGRFNQYLENKGLPCLKIPQRVLTSFEENEKSQAYLPHEHRKVYYAGGFNGGKSSEYIDLIKELKNRIDIDLSNNLIARWHDESHLNKYLNEAYNVRTLSPSYCYAYGYNLRCKPIIVALEKNHSELRNHEHEA